MGFVWKRKSKQPQTASTELILQADWPVPVSVRLWAGCLHVYRAPPDRQEPIVYPSFAGFVSSWPTTISLESIYPSNLFLNRKKLILQAHQDSLPEVIFFKKIKGFKTDPEDPAQKADRAKQQTRLTSRPNWTIDKTEQWKEAKKRRTPCVRVLRQQISIAWLVKVTPWSAKVFHRPCWKTKFARRFKDCDHHDNPEKNETDSAFFIFKETKSGFYALLVYG